MEYLNPVNLVVNAINPLSIPLTCFINLFNLVELLLSTSLLAKVDIKLTKIDTQVNEIDRG